MSVRMQMIAELMEYTVQVNRNITRKELDDIQKGYSNWTDDIIADQYRDLLKKEPPRSWKTSVR